MLLLYRSGPNEIVMVSNQIIAPPVNQNTDIRTQPPTRKIPKQDLRNLSQIQLNHFFLQGFLIRIWRHQQSLAQQSLACRFNSNR